MVDSLADLKKLIKLCRETGVDAIEIGGVKIGFGPMPIKTKAFKPSKAAFEMPQQPTITPGGITEETEIPTDGLTEDQLLFYSAQGHTEQQ